MERLLRIEDRQNQQTGRIIGNGQQKQEHNCRMPVAKNQPRDEIAERDIRRTGNRPASTERLCFTQQMDSGKVNQRRRDDASGRRHQWRCRSSRIRQRPSRQQSLPDFLGSDCKEQSHRDVVDQKMQINMPLSEHREFVMHKLAIPDRVTVGPDQSDDGSANQKERVLQQKRNGPLEWSRRLIRFMIWICFSHMDNEFGTV